MGGGGGQHQGAGGHQAFLVGQSQDRALLQGAQARLQPGHADDGRHDPIGGAAGSLDQRIPPGGGQGVRALQGSAQGGQTGFVGADGNLRA